MLATYSGSKSFVATWSQALAEEYKKKGIVVQLVNTFFVVRDGQIMTRLSPKVTVRYPTCQRFDVPPLRLQLLRHLSDRLSRTLASLVVPLLDPSP
jgi:NAD(P)-dependent dehydrogenase (short-subunit alcohol dehydrogenase family)